MKSGIEKIKQKVATLGSEANGWRVTLNGFGDRQAYNGDWLLRAAAAMAGIYGNSPSEAVYPLLATDSTGNKPDTSTNRYTLAFPEGGLPPVEAFWSVTMYDGKTQLLIVNPINRYLINSPMIPDLKKNSDGSITLHIQKDSPGADKSIAVLPFRNLSGPDDEYFADGVTEEILNALAQLDGLRVAARRSRQVSEPYRPAHRP